MRFIATYGRQCQSYLLRRPTPRRVNASLIRNICVRLSLPPVDLALCCLPVVYYRPPTGYTHLFRIYPERRVFTAFHALLHRRERIYRLCVSFSFNESLSIGSLHLLPPFFSFFYFCIRNWAQVFNADIFYALLLSCVPLKFLLHCLRKKKKKNTIFHT